MPRNDLLQKKDIILQWIDEGLTKTEICNNLKCKISTLNLYLEKMGIEYAGRPGGQSINGNKYQSASEYLYDNSKISSWKLKNKLLKEKIKPSQCEMCGLTNWLGQNMPLELHHKDGNRYNNCLDNLQLLCPNCHAIQENNCGKNIGKYSENQTKKEAYCQECGVKISINTVSRLCTKCAAKNRRNKIEIIPKNQLLSDIKYNNLKQLSEKYGVCTKTIKKWCKFYGININSKNNEI